MNYGEIKEYAYFLTNTDTNSYSESDLVRNLNAWLRKAWVWIENFDADWQFDDSNKSTTPIATTDLTKGQQQYSIPSNALTIERLEIKDEDGNWVKLIDINETDINIALGEFEDTDSTPQYYDMMGNGIYLYPAPDYDKPEGLKGIFSRDMNEFTAGSTSFTPGIPVLFHNVLAYGAALDYAIANLDSSKEVDLRRQIFGGNSTPGIKNEMQEFFAKRQRDSSPRLGIDKSNYES